MLCKARPCTRGLAHVRDISKYIIITTVLFFFFEAMDLFPVLLNLKTFQAIHLRSQQSKRSKTYFLASLNFFLADIAKVFGQIIPFWTGKAILLPA
jgi:hypothetical protein